MKLAKLATLLALKEGYIKDIATTQTNRKLQNTNKALVDHVWHVGQSGDLGNIIETEKSLLLDELNKYANSKAMVTSLKNALTELKAAEHLVKIVGDKKEYKSVDEAHSLPKNRKNGLPWDEAQQAFSSHYARLVNQDKSRLDDEEKKLIDARKTNMFTARKIYAEKQAQTLGISPIKKGSIKI